MRRRALEGAGTREVTRIPAFPCQPPGREVFVTLRARLDSKRGPLIEGTHPMKSSLRIACLVALLTACRESPPAPAAPAAPAAPPRTAAEQIGRGAQLFAANCAKCHGDSGQGSEDVPPLVGKGALPLYPRPNQMRAAKFHTALDVALFATKQMPPSSRARARLTSDDYWSILAFALDANGVKLKQPAGPDNAGSIVLHP